MFTSVTMLDRCINDAVTITNAKAMNSMYTVMVIKTQMEQTVGKACNTYCSAVLQKRFAATMLIVLMRSMLPKLSWTPFDTSSVPQRFKARWMMILKNTRLSLCQFVVWLTMIPRNSIISMKGRTQYKCWWWSSPLVGSLTRSLWHGDCADDTEVKRTHIHSKQRMHTLETRNSYTPCEIAYVRKFTTRSDYLCAAGISVWCDDPVVALLQGGGHRDAGRVVVFCVVWLWFFGSVIMITMWLHGHVMLYSCNLVLVIL